MEKQSHLQELRKTAVELMNIALEYWQKAEPNQSYSCSKLAKIELAEKSKLWRVYLDKGVYQTRTLDKYLQYHTLPKYPRWGSIIQTVEYILNHYPVFSPKKKELEKKLEQLETMLIKKDYKNE